MVAKSNSNIQEGAAAAGKGSAVAVSRSQGYLLGAESGGQFKLGLQGVWQQPQLSDISENKVGGRGVLVFLIWVGDV